MPGHDHREDQASLDLQRDLGVLAAKAEENRRFLELALEAERSRSRDLEAGQSQLKAKLAEASATAARGAARVAHAEEQVSVKLAAASAQAASREAALRAELDALRERAALRSSLDSELRRAKEAGAAAESELQAVWQQLCEEQEASAAMRAEVQSLKQQLQQAQDYAKRSIALQAEVNRLRQQSEAAVSEARLQAELEKPTSEPDVQREEATVELPEPAKQAGDEEEVTSLRRELRGMKILVTALERKVKTYEDRLLEHSRTCADELNTMHPMEQGGGYGSEASKGGEVSDRGRAALQMGGQIFNSFLAGLSAAPPGSEPEAESGLPAQNCAALAQAGSGGGEALIF
eukprot:TRINITY_DN102608_c0_g1_i1.p1 TRINITY_DN102608_c0_g1~~TRINITY_DN102608_c0_g1_i1.p1  ORF type:complete len:348 (-),score=109.51 TRINITY_DN102608_c0_g1_i1:53-1096(-)